jgi:hypothetical protein
MFGAHYATGIRGAFSHGPLHPISKGGRVIIFLAGMAVFVEGFNCLVNRSGGPQVWWRNAVPFVAVAILAGVLNSKRVRTYSGKTTMSRPTVAIRFSGQLPSVLVGLRVAFFVIVALMLVFGVGPIAPSMARAGIVFCVLALFALGLLYGVFENHYVNTGRATEVKLTDDNPQT